MTSGNLYRDQTGSLRDPSGHYHSVRATSPTGQNREDSNRSRSRDLSYTTRSDVAYCQVHSSDHRKSSETIELQHLTKGTDSNRPPAKQPKSFRSCSVTLLCTWRWELSIWLLGTAGLIANVALLICFNGVEQRAWKSNVQITAFVAALAQLSQSALLVPTGSSLGQLKWRWLQQDRKAVDIDRFDLASRGPDGSLRLLWHLRLRPHLTTLGALSTLLMLAFPTFVQQSVAVNTRRFKAPDDGASYVQRAGDARYQLPSFGLEEHSGFDLGPLPDSVAVVQAIFSSYINLANVTGFCSTGSCSWEPYATLSVRATTEDVTHRLTAGNVTNNGTQLPPYIGKTTPGIVDYGYSPPVRSNTTFYSYIERPKDDVGYPEDVSMYDNNTDIALPDFASIYLLYYDPCKEVDAHNEDFNRTLDIQYWSAVKANFHACVQTVNVTFDGFWQANLVDSTRDLSWHTSLWGEGMLAYCLSLHALDDFCLSHTLLFNIGGSLGTVYNVSAEVRNDYGSNYETTSPLHASKWTNLLSSDFRREDGYTAPNYCKKNASEEFDNRIQRIAASLSIEMHNTEGSSVRVNGTAWRTGT